MKVLINNIIQICINSLKVILLLLIFPLMLFSSCSNKDVNDKTVDVEGFMLT